MLSILGEKINGTKNSKGLDNPHMRFPGEVFVTLTSECGAPKPVPTGRRERKRPSASDTWFTDKCFSLIALTKWYMFTLNFKSTDHKIIQILDLEDTS